MRDYLKETNTKYIESYYKGVPELVNSYGSLKSLLKEILTTPYNIQEILEVEKLEGLLKIKLYLGHGFYKDQVVSCSGFNIEDLNIDFRIADVGLDFIIVKFENEAVIDFTGVSLTIEGTPLGYDIVFEDESEGIICFKNKSTRSPAILKLIDHLPPNDYNPTWSKFARVCIGQELNSEGNFVDDRKAPYHPDYINCELTGNGVKGASGVHGFAKWTYSLRTSNASQENVAPSADYQGRWTLVGDDKCFYLMINTVGLLSDNNYSFDLVGFGTFESYNPLETSNICLQAKDGFISADSNSNTNPTRPRSFFGSLNYTDSGFILTDNFNNHKTGYNRCKNIGYYLSTSSMAHPWRTSGIQPCDVNLNIIKTDMIIKDHLNYIRGKNRGIYSLYGFVTTKDSFVDSKGNLFKTVQDPLATTEYSKAPILFSLLNWEEV